MVNPRLIELAKRQMNKEKPKKERNYPTPESYTIPKAVYYEHLRLRDESHPELLEDALNSIRATYATLREYYDPLETVVAVVGSSLHQTTYKDIDLVLLGIQNPDFGKELFRKANSLINGNPPSQINQNTLLYSGNAGPFWPAGLSTSDFLQPRDYLIDLILDKTGRLFYDWHKMMVSSNQLYCILDKDIESSAIEKGDDQ